MNTVRNIVYALGFRPKKGSPFYSPSKAFIFGGRRALKISKKAYKTWRKG
jgi:hypothetical protein